MNILTIERNVLAKNDEIAGRNRRLLRGRGIFAVNLVSSPGSGKTSLLECTLEDGTVTDAHRGLVVMKTSVGGSRVVDMLSGEQLPRIC